MNHFRVISNWYIRSSNAHAMLLHKRYSCSNRPRSVSSCLA